MNWWGSGFVPIIIYSTQNHGSEISEDILTEDDEVILTESGLPLMTE